MSLRSVTRPRSCSSVIVARHSRPSTTHRSPLQHYAITVASLANSPRTRPGLGLVLPIVVCILAAMPGDATIAAVLLRLALWSHVAFGFAAFAIAPVAILTAKGGPAHRQAGRWYVWAMAGVAGTAILLAVALPRVFLALVAVFSFYAAFAGYRMLRLKDLSAGGRPHAIDWAAGVVTLFSSVGLGVMGVTAPALMGVGVMPVLGRPVSVVAVAFGGVGVGLAVLMMRHFIRRPREKMFWWYAHMQGMLASYIAAWSAFSAVNLSRAFGPVWWVWLWPTLLGTPLIVGWVIVYRFRFGDRTRRPPTPHAAID